MLAPQRSANCSTTCTTGLLIGPRLLTSNANSRPSDSCTSQRRLSFPGVSVVVTPLYAARRCGSPFGLPMRSALVTKNSVGPSPSQPKRPKFTSLLVFGDPTDDSPAPTA